ncbi:MAG: hypothetical protein M0Q38_14790 [Bacteroidales bacterium]|jgi:diaminopimelate decarboxylase|nr:hypothetical protein [Bacteroidales bacterium]
MFFDNQSGLSVGNIERSLTSAIAKGFLRNEDTAAIFYDLTFLQSRIGRLVSCFPSTTLHALAIKANPLIRIMNFIKTIHSGIGVEAASMGEVNLALKTGYSPDRIVYDSPVKTRAELESALKTGVHINVDNLSELERIKKLLEEMGYGDKLSSLNSDSPQTYDKKNTIGIRINPQIGLGTIVESSVAGEYSKFGVPIRDQRPSLEKVFLNYSWLTGVHLHVGSQGCAMQMLIDGIGILYDFMLEMNEKRLKKGFPPISNFDIGGGLPVSYRRDEKPPSMEDYVAAIRMRAPGLFETQSSNLKYQNHNSKLKTNKHSNFQIFKSSNFQITDTHTIITEFGRWTYTNAGWTVSRVEYVKHDPAINTAMLHVGADLFVRECLNPRDWHHEYSVFDSQGSLKTGVDDHPYNLAGPLCFAGDIIAKGVQLPRMEEDDYVVIHDSGSYTFSMWSRYNSRQTPRILGYFNEGEKFEVLKERESLDDICSYWK